MASVSGNSFTFRAAGWIQTFIQFKASIAIWWSNTCFSAIQNVFNKIISFLQKTYLKLLKESMWFACCYIQLSERFKLILFKYLIRTLILNFSTNIYGTVEVVWFGLKSLIGQWGWVFVLESVTWFMD